MIRTLAHELLELTAKCCGKTVSAILAPYKGDVSAAPSGIASSQFVVPADPLLSPVLHTSLHSVPTSIRIGYVSAGLSMRAVAPTFVV